MLRIFSGRRLAAALAVVASALLAPVASAAVIDFESGPPTIYGFGESFVEDDYTLTVLGDFGVIDSAATCVIALCPTGNDTQFYSGVNDGHLQIVQTDGGRFNVRGFFAGFLAPIFQEPGVFPGQIVVVGQRAGGPVTLAFDFAPSAGDGAFPFAQYGPGLFSSLTRVTSLDIFACTFTETGACENINQNLSQFSIDNIRLQTLPEPTTLLLLALGLSFLAFRRRAVR